MGILFICILCNVLLAVIFKYFALYKVDNINAIIINYIVCVLFSSIILGELSVPMDILDRPWLPFSIVLGCLFMFGFNIMALSFQKSGVALTAIIQKMSLIVPSAVAIAIYGEPLGIFKASGILLALTAIVLVNIPSKENPDKINLFHPLIIYPLLTFLLSGIIEVILFYVEVEGLVVNDGMQFTATSFAIAASIGLVFSIYRSVTKKVFVSRKEILGGIALGLPNYLTIYLLVYLLSKGWQGSVLFPTNSIGILVLTALVGFIFYKEHADKMKLIGIGLGVLAILLLSAA